VTGKGKKRASYKRNLPNMPSKHRCTLAPRKKTVLPHTADIVLPDGRERGIIREISLLKLQIEPIGSCVSCRRWGKGGELPHSHHPEVSLGFSPLQVNSSCVVRKDKK